MFFDDSLVLELFIFLGFSMSWIGCFVGLLIGGVVLFWKVFLSWLRFLGWFGFIFRLSGLLRGLINNGFLFKLSLRGFPFKEGTTGDLSSL